MPVGGKLSLTGLRDDTPNHIGHHGAAGAEGAGGTGSSAAVPVGGGGPGRASWRRAEPHVSTPGAAGVEGVGGTGGRERAWLRCPWAVAGLAGHHGDAPNHTSARQAPLVWRAPEGPGARPRCPWAVAGPGRSSRRRAGRSSRRGRLAGGPPPTGTPSSPAQQAPGTPVGPQQQAPRQRAQAYKNRHPDRMSACGGARGIRTPDLLIANETRYQLRHSPKDSSSLAPWPAPTQADHRRVRELTKPQARRNSTGRQELQQRPALA